MITWQHYLQMLRDDDVFLDHIDTGDIDDGGRAKSIACLTRNYNGRLLYYPLAGTIDPSEPVHKRTRRQIANTLRLPVEKYVFPDSEDHT